MKINMADWEEYFSKQTAPANLKDTKTIVAEFAANHRAAGRNVVLMTSGGTAVPLESNTVRFIDNFSSGTRGAASAEQFLQQGYAVIFLFRQHSLQPFSRHISPDSFLDILEFKGDNEGSLRIEVDETRAPNIRDILKKYHEVQVLGTLLLVEFNTLSDYLFLLRTMSEALGNLGPQIMFYLAAAVSDFYIPEESMFEHKIQSDCGPLQLVMQQVPKMLSPLVKEWAENAFVVSFKLETDVNIISKKAREALTKYNHQVVVSNILQTRKKTVVIVTPAHEMAVWMSDEELEQGKEIEAKIVTELIKMHHRFISNSTIQGGTQGQFIPGQLQEGVPLPQVQQFQYGVVQPTQLPPTPHDTSSTGYCDFSPNTTTSVTHIRIRKNEENSSSPTSPIPEESIPPTPTTPNSGGKGNSRFGILSDLSLTTEMKDFIESFRNRRIALGYTQEDVGYELSRTNGPSYSQSFISRFESKNLGLKAAEKMKPVMQSWLEQKELECSKGLRVCKKRKRRTSFSNEVLRFLITYFEQNPKPSSSEITQIAKDVNLEPVTVRVWFCNRKQMLKRMATGKTRVNNSLKAELEAKSKIEISPSKEGKLDFTNMPVGQFSFTEDRVKPLVCVGSEGSPVKKGTHTPSSCVTFAQVQDDTIVHSTALTGSPVVYGASEPVTQVNHHFSFPEVDKSIGLNIGNTMKTTTQTPTSYVPTQTGAINSSAGTVNHVAYAAESLSEPGTHVEHAAVVSLNFDSPVVHKVHQVPFSRPMGEEYQTEHS